MMKSNTIEDVYPLSPMQEGLLFHSLLTPNSTNYREQITCFLEGRIDYQALNRAWQFVVDRHAVLRSAFAWQDLERPLQLVGRRVKSTVHFLDWQHLPMDVQAQQITAFLDADIHQGFDLSRAPLMRAHLIRVNDQSHFFIWNYHHLLLDGWSTWILIREIFTCYDSFCLNLEPDLPPTPLFRDYIAWLQKDLTQAETYWRRTLKGLKAPTSLGIDHMIVNTTFDDVDDQDEQELSLSLETTAALRLFARQSKITLSTVIQGMIALLLGSYNRESDIIFGTVVSGRSNVLPGIDSMVGVCINNLPLRIRLDRDKTAISWLRDLQAQVAQINQYEYTPLTKIKEWSEIPKQLPLFEISVAFENYPTGFAYNRLSNSLAINKFKIREKTSFPFNIVIGDGESTRIRISYSLKRFRGTAISRFLKHLEVLLQKIVSFPHIKISEQYFVPESEREQLLKQWNKTEIRFPNDLCVHQLFEDRVKKTPDCVAVVFKGHFLTYNMLNTKANQLAHTLIQSGVKPDVPVGIYMRPSLELIIALIAIMKSGGAYVPIDPDFPKYRVEAILEDTGMPILITSTEEDDNQNWLRQRCQIVSLEDSDMDRGEVPNPNVELYDRHLSYIIYTSGSTGKPKGVAIEHRSLVNYILGILDRLELSTGEVFATTSSFTADLGNTMIYASLCTSGCLHIVERACAIDPVAISEYFSCNPVDYLKIVPSHFEALFISSQSERLFPRKKLIFGGETTSKALLEKLNTIRKECQIVNHYGPTETTVGVILYQQGNSTYEQHSKTLFLGKPLPNSRIYLLDSSMRPVPIGIPGEIYVGGGGLARGYYNSAEETSNRFRPDPFSIIPGSRIYWTGDLGCYHEDGTIEFLGRVDQQVKIQGYRIELAEIEVALKNYPKIRDCAVTLVVSEGEKRLIAYIVLQTNEAPPNILDLYQFLKNHLPTYMIPSGYIVLNYLPRTPSGKIDRRSLSAHESFELRCATAQPELSMQHFTRDDQTPNRNIDFNTLLPQDVYQLKLERKNDSFEPRDWWELQLSRIWQNILGINNVSIRDNFFELGGNSIRAIHLVDRIQQLCGRTIPVAAIFQYPTVEEFASFLRQVPKVPISCLVPLQPNGDKARLFLIHPLGGEVTCYWNLVKYLEKDQPVYGLQAKGLYTNNTPNTTVEAMAETYINEICSVQPEGPYLIAGLSSGGLVAFEIAQQLLVRGQQVDLLALMDTSHPSYLPDRDMVALILDEFSSLALSEYQLRQMDAEAQIDCLLQRLQESGSLPADTNLEWARRYFSVLKIHFRAYRQYIPKIYPGNLVYMQASERKINQFAPSPLQWSSLVAKEIKTFTVPGRHNTMCKEPNVRVLAERLNSLIGVIKHANHS